MMSEARYSCTLCGAATGTDRAALGAALMLDHIRPVTIRVIDAPECALLSVPHTNQDTQAQTHRPRQRVWGTWRLGGKIFAASASFQHKRQTKDMPKHAHTPQMLPLPYLRLNPRNLVGNARL